MRKVSHPWKSDHFESILVKFTEHSESTGWTHPALASVWTFLPVISNFGVQNNNTLLHIIVNSVYSNIFQIPWEEGKVDFHSYDNST